MKRRARNGPIDWRDRTAVQKDVANLRAAVDGAAPTEAFMTAASPGVIAHFLQNTHYPSREAYLARLVDVMKEEYDAIHRAGFVLQVDCPDLAMSRHLAFPDLSNAAFVKLAEGNVEALNHALRDIPPDRMRLHLCWGNYEGPHHRDIPLKEILPIALKSRPQALSFEGANPRHEHEWIVFKDVKLPDDRLIIPGVLDSTTNFIEHPELVAQRLIRYAEVVGRVRRLRPADWKRPVPRPEGRDPWTVQDALAHILYWKAHTCRVFRGEKRLPEMRGLDIEQINRKIYNRWRRRWPSALVAWHRRVHAEVVKTIAKTPPEFFNRKNRSHEC